MIDLKKSTLSIATLLILTTLSLLSNLALADVSKPTTSGITFDEWRLNQAADQVKALQKDSSGLSSSDIDRSKKRASEAVKKGDWDVAASEYARIVGYFPDERKNWAALSLALQNKNKQEGEWKTLEAAKLAGINLYLLSKTPEEQAEALLIYGNTLLPEDDESPSYLAVYEAAQALTNVSKLKAAHPELASLMAFEFRKIRVNNQSNPPSVCFDFSHSLATNTTHLSDFFSITPKVEGQLKISGRELCLLPVQFGVNYDTTLKAGIKDIYGEKIPTDVSLSFKVKDQPSLLSFKTKAYVLRKEEKAYVPLSGINVDAVKISILRINDRSLNQTLGQSENFLEKLWEYSVDQIEDNRGELLYEGEMNFSNAKNESVTKLIPFFQVVKKTKPGIYIIQAEEKGTVLTERARATQWVIVSDLGITTFTQADGGIWANIRSLKTAGPLANVEVKLLANNNAILKTLKTNNEGMAFFESNVTSGKGGNRPLAVYAYGPNEDFSFLTLSQPAFDLSDRGVSGRQKTGGLDVFLFTEQGVYRPGDTVHFTALMRDEKGNAKGGFPLIFKVLRSDGILVSEQTLLGNELGFYESALPLQSSSRTGQWTVLAYLDTKKNPIGRVQFSVEDFVPSRVAVNLSSPKTILKAKESFPIDLSAHYLYGAPAEGLKGEGSVTLQVRTNSFPKWVGYHFGLITDAFRNVQTTFSVKPLDNDGKVETTVLVDKIPETTQPLQAQIKVSLSDTGGREENAAMVIPVETTPFMIGIKPNFGSNTLSESENNATFEVAAINEQQDAVAVQQLEYELYAEQPQYTWYQPDQYSAWQYQQRLEDKFLMRGNLSTQKALSEKLTIPVQDWGQYRLEIKDPKTLIASSVRFNKGFEPSGDSGLSPDKISVRVNQNSISPGGSVELQIVAPFEGQALLTVANEKVLETRNIPISSKGSRIKLTANENWGVGVYCLVSAFRPLTEKSFLPKRAIGLAWVGIDPVDKLLDISFDLPPEAKPRETIDIPVLVKGRSQLNGNKGSSGKIQMEVAAVDEGILKLTEYVTPNPENYFFGKYRLPIELRDLYGKLIDPLPGTIGELHVGGDVGLLSRNLEGLTKRSFKVVSLYQGLVDLDQNGQGKIQLKLPDFNGSLRVMAVAFGEKTLGSKEALLLVRDSIVVEGIMARFLSPEDTSELALTIDNIKGTEGTYQLQLKSEGQIKLEGENTINLNLKQKEHKELTIPIKALSVGEGRVFITLSGNGLNIERSFDISVRPKQPYQLVSESQLLKSDEETSLKNSVLKNFVPGSLQSVITFSASVPWDTAAILKQLRIYPYGCAEQTTSKAIGALFSGIPNDDYIVGQAMATLSENQTGPGYFTLWNGAGNTGDIFLTAYVSDFLLRAKERGLTIPKFTLERSLDWLSNSINQQKENKDNLTATAYAIYVLTKADRIETGAIRYFFDTNVNDMNDPLARAFMGTALAFRNDLDRTKEAYQNILDLFNNPDNTAYTPYGTQLRDKLALLSLMRETLNSAPSLNQLSEIANTLVPILSRDIQKTQIMHLSTQELAWAVLAANSLGEEKSNVPIEILFNNKPYSSDSKNLTIPLDEEALSKDINITNKSKKSLWQNWLISGLPKEAPKAQSEGIEIERQYFNLKGEKLLLKEIKQSTQMVVVIEGLVKDERPHQLMIVDYLPAGLEIQNARLGQGDGQLPESYLWLGTGGTLSKTEYTDARDDRLVASLFLDEKTRTFRLAYELRAVTPGLYYHPGLYVEDMYAPQFFARTNAETVKVLPH